MTSQEAREHFSDAYEGDLSSDTLSDFEAALSADAALSSEYASFQDLLQNAEQHAGPVGATPDLLRGVQKRLRGSTRNRFYGDRLGAIFGRGGISPLLLGMCIVALVALLWLTLDYFQKLQQQEGHSMRPVACELAGVKGVKEQPFHPCKQGSGRSGS